MPKLTFFMHIPKTAGTTLHQIIQRQYPAGSIFSAYIGVGAATLGEHLDNLRSQLAAGQNIQLILGHIGFGLHEALGQDLTQMTILRDPVERVVSWYYHQRRVADAKFRQECLRLNLAEVLQQLPVFPLDNHQTRYLSGDFLHHQLTGEIKIPYGQCTGELLAIAKHNLAQYFAVVGIQSNFDQTLRLLQKILGWQDLSYTRANVSPERQVDDHTADLIRQANTWDLQLYNYAQTLFTQQCQKYLT